MRTVVLSTQKLITKHKFYSILNKIHIEKWWQLIIESVNWFFGKYVRKWTSQENVVSEWVRTEEKKKNNNLWFVFWVCMLTVVIFGEIKRVREKRKSNKFNLSF